MVNYVKSPVRSFEDQITQPTKPISSVLPLSNDLDFVQALNNRDNIISNDRTANVSFFKP